MLVHLIPPQELGFINISPNREVLSHTGCTALYVSTAVGEIDQQPFIVFPEIAGIEPNCVVCGKTLPLTQSIAALQSLRKFRTFRIKWLL